MVKLQVHVTWGRTRHLIREIDVTNYTPEEINDVIKKQHDLLCNCDCIIKRKSEMEV